MNSLESGREAECPCGLTEFHILEVVHQKISLKRGPDNRDSMPSFVRATDVEIAGVMPMPEEVAMMSS